MKHHQRYYLITGLQYQLHLRSFVYAIPQSIQSEVNKKTKERQREGMPQVSTKARNCSKLVSCKYIKKTNQNPKHIGDYI